MSTPHDVGRFDSIYSPALFERTGAQQRLALRPFTFSNGQTIPAGTMLACPVLSLHRDEENYPDAAEFRPRRHCAGGEAHKNLFVTTKPDFMPFGHGADAW